MATAANQGTGVAVAFVGSGGAGSLTTGNILLEAACAAGLHGLLVRTLGPQIRGGEAAALLRLATRPVECAADRLDLLIGIDWLNAERFGAELKVGPETLVIGDPEGAEPPPAVTGSGARLIALPLAEMAKAVEGGRPNMIALGLAGRLLGFDIERLSAVVAEHLTEKGAAAIAASRSGIEIGFAAAEGIEFAPRLTAPESRSSRRWLLSGNEATGLGAIRGGIRFAAAYPITPATEILEWLAPNLTKAGGLLLQAEDELAAINMIVGASYGGTPSLTATSGPGLSLMVEALGLATSAEVPIVVVDVMRGGPSTGIPTKSEQADLNIAVYGLHGDAPHLVLAPQSVGDCLFTTQWATYLAEALQAPAIVLSDQFMGQARASIERPADLAFVGKRTVAAQGATAYKRYALAAGGVSPMAIPGTPGCQYTADGLTHTETGTPTSGAEHHLAQLDKRQGKLDGFDYGNHWATIEGGGEIAVLTWGSLTGAAREACERLAAEGIAVRLVSPRLLLPARPDEMARALDGVKRILVVEQTHGGQFHHYLRAHYDFPAPLQALHRPGPLPITAGEICRALKEGR